MEKRKTALSIHNTLNICKNKRFLTYLWTVEILCPKGDETHGRVSKRKPIIRLIRAYKFLKICLKVVDT